ncbi:YesL family protein [Agrobacterium larrymoorei]|uniref:YesL family protein n=1 Tax=Agrobacterium larrymoorei TaxID=160699 RepID=UPI001572D92C|nr:YesL family protein [Agrobacterium larrymoorei]NTJ44630.1 YesL family protein [Agrobacterium larrymoorei]
MQWLEGLWTKEGAGIDKDAPKLTGLALFFDIVKREWWEMVKLNLLFIIASLPLVTMPAATLAMARVSRSFALDENTYLLRDFIEAFRDYALRGTLLLTICATVVGACVYTTISYAQATQHGILYSAPLAISAAVTLYLCIVTAYATALLAARDLSILAALKEAALFAVVKPLPMLFALAFVAALWLAHILFYPVSVFMPATINFSLGMFAISFAAIRMVKDELSQDQTE